MVNGLPLPPLLLEMLAQNCWRHPGDMLLQTVIPWIKEPLDFLPSSVEMELNSVWTDWLDQPNVSHIMHVARGSVAATSIILPWLDGEQFICIAASRDYGADCAIMLDYRTSYVDPRVVASDWSHPPDGCLWREVASTFSEFVQQLDL